METSPYLFHLLEKGTVEKCAAGTRFKVDQGSFPVLADLSLYKITLEERAFREPHWHPNANELCYVLSGKVGFSFFSPDNMSEKVDANPGDIVFIPRGYVHSIENIGPGKAEVSIGFDAPNPKEFSLARIFHAIPKEMQEEAYGFSTTPLGQEVETLFSFRKGPPEVFPKANRHKLPLSALNPLIDKQGGTIKLVWKEDFPILQGNITLYDLVLNAGGLREPHWHPNASELDYIVQGKARMHLQTPEGEIFTFEAGKGDVVYFPKAYFHAIENIGEEKLHIVVYFSDIRPEDIGISGSVGNTSSELIEAVFGLDPGKISSLKKFKQDRFVIP